MVWECRSVVWECGVGVLECGSESVEVWEWWGSPQAGRVPCYMVVYAQFLVVYIFTNVLGNL